MSIRWPWNRKSIFSRSIPPLRAAALSDVGKVRENNEDAYVALPERGLFIVSDGMGGHLGGEVASEIVVEVLPLILEERMSAAELSDFGDVASLVHDAIVDLSNQVQRQSADQPGLSGMGATVVVACALGDRAIIANLGDSRVYRYREPDLEQLTEDHSIVGILLRGGDIETNEVKDHPARGRLSRFLGMEGEVLPDVIIVEFVPGDRLLLCSDGLSGEVDDGSMSVILDQESSCETACQRLIDAALAAGGGDNITVLVADRLEELEHPTIQPSVSSTSESTENSTESPNKER